RTRSVSQKSVDAIRQARFFSPFSSSSLKTGTNAPESAASATSARTGFGVCGYSGVEKEDGSRAREAVGVRAPPLERGGRRVGGGLHRAGLGPDSPSRSCYHRAARDSGRFLEWRTSSSSASALGSRSGNGPR